MSWGRKIWHVEFVCHNSGVDFFNIAVCAKRKKRLICLEVDKSVALVPRTSGFHVWVICSGLFFCGCPFDENFQ